MSNIEEMITAARPSRLNNNSATDYLPPILHEKIQRGDSIVYVQTIHMTQAAVDYIREFVANDANVDANWPLGGTDEARTLRRNLRIARQVTEKIEDLSERFKGTVPLKIEVESYKTFDDDSDSVSRERRISLA